MTDIDRVQVLKMIEAGQLTAAEGIRRLNEVEPAARPAELSGRWLRIRVTDRATQRPKVSVNLPLAWLTVGLHIGSRYAPELTRLDVSEIVEVLRSGADGRIVEVEDEEDGERVEVFVD